MKDKSAQALFLNIGLSLVIALAFYSIQFIILKDWFLEQSTVFNYAFRLMRMILGYLVPPLIFLRRYNQSFLEMGLRYISRRSFFFAIFGGILLYLVPSFIFVKYDIFASQWKFREWGLTILLLFFIGSMAALTDLWTRGFLLLQVEHRYGVIMAVLAQNFVWFILHVYEIVLLLDFIGLIAAILLTLFLGIVGDLIVLKTSKNVVGLMIGHVMLNIFIVLDGKELLNF